MPAWVTKARKLDTRQNQTMICTMGVRLESERMTWFNCVDIVTERASETDDGQRLPTGGHPILAEYKDILIAYAWQACWASDR